MTDEKIRFITLKHEKGGYVSIGDDITTKFMGKGIMALKGRDKEKMCYTLKVWNTIY